VTGRGGIDVVVNHDTDSSGGLASVRGASLESGTVEEIGYDELGRGLGKAEVGGQVGDEEVGGVEIVVGALTDDQWPRQPAFMLVTVHHDGVTNLFEVGDALDLDDAGFGSG